jgi:hypothetical protein
MDPNQSDYFMQQQQQQQYQQQHEDDQYQGHYSSIINTDINADTDTDPSNVLGPSSSSLLLNHYGDIEPCEYDHTHTHHGADSDFNPPASMNTTTMHHDHDFTAMPAYEEPEPIHVPIQQITIPSPPRMMNRQAPNPQARPQTYSPIILTVQEKSLLELERDATIAHMTNAPMAVDDAGHNAPSLTIGTVTTNTTMTMTMTSADNFTMNTTRDSDTVGNDIARNADAGNAYYNPDATLGIESAPSIHPAVAQPVHPQPQSQLHQESPSKSQQYHSDVFHQQVVMSPHHLSMALLPPSPQQQITPNHQFYPYQQPLPPLSLPVTSPRQYPTLMTSASGSTIPLIKLNLHAKPNNTTEEHNVDNVRDSRNMLSNYKAKIIASALTPERNIISQPRNTTTNIDTNHNNSPSRYLTIPQAIALVNNPMLIPKYKKRKYSKHHTLSFNAMQPARYRYYQRTILPSAAQMSAAIPKNASSIFHIWDRRIDFDSLREDTLSYSLLRSWVRDDPYRKAMKYGIGGDLVDRIVLPNQKRGVNVNTEVEEGGEAISKQVTIVEEQDAMELKRLEEKDKMLQQVQVQIGHSFSSSKESSSGSCNILDHSLIGTSGISDMNQYLKDYIKKGRMRRTCRNRLMKKRDDICLKRLKKVMGIKVKTVGEKIK